MRDLSGTSSGNWVILSSTSQSGRPDFFGETVELRLCCQNHERSRERLSKCDGFRYSNVLSYWLFGLRRRACDVAIGCVSLSFELSKVEKEEGNGNGRRSPRKIRSFSGWKMWGNTSLKDFASGSKGVCRVVFIARRECFRWKFLVTNWGQSPWVGQGMCSSIREESGAMADGCVIDEICTWYICKYSPSSPSFVLSLSP